jgi:4-hydroxythreonine-4-phosphate dehydrogenase
LVITMGEPAGIGGEITLRAWLALRDQGAPFAVIDNASRLADIAQAFRLAVPVKRISTLSEAKAVFADALPVLEIPACANLRAVLGQPSVTTAKAVIAAIEYAVRLVKANEASGIVTNPIQKATLQSDGFAFPGHTEYLGYLAGSDQAVMMLAVERPDPPLRVVPVTVHTPISRVAATLSIEDIIKCGRVTARALQRDFGIAQPRLAVTGLNPHAGEAGKIGDEEIRLITPAIAALRAEGLDVSGPWPADTLFHEAARRTYDVAICMYHDQALVPLKTLDFAGGVNVTLGLPFVRTSPDHGTALDIATKGIADPTSLMAALTMAARMAAARAA